VDSTIANWTPRPIRSRGWIERLLEPRVLSALDNWQDGQLMVQLPDGRCLTYGDRNGERAEIHVHDLNAYRRVVLGADIGIGEAYMAGEWSSPDLPGLISAFIRNREHIGLDMQGAFFGLPGRIFNRALHLLRRNTESGSQKNIHAHYDLGNEFYELFLDETMAYSSAIYPSGDCSLEEAQRHKYETICRKLELGSNDHLLEIGSGWGGLAIHAAKTTGCRVTTITISKAQLEGARKRVAEAGLSDRIEVRYSDYRQMEGRYDKIVSVEMLEAVGEEYWDTFFGKIDTLLAPGGRVLIQVICVPDVRYASYGPASDWIRKYVFPGGRLPSLYELQRSVRRATLLETLGVEEIGAHYAPTLRAWRERFFQNLEVVRRQGFGESFVRLWDFYLASCEASFSMQWNRNVQLLLAPPASPMFCKRTGD
jgi:cyclopropane-fatty-acyl-phospholipid synthase